jgi:hypothetical protein
VTRMRSEGASRSLRQVGEGRARERRSAEAVPIRRLPAVTGRPPGPSGKERRRVGGIISTPLPVRAWPGRI